MGQCASGAFHERRKRRAAFGDFLFELHDIGYGQHVLLGFAKKRQQRFAVGVDQVGEFHFCVRWGVVEGSVVHGTPNVGSMSLR